MRLWAWLLFCLPASGALYFDGASTILSLNGSQNGITNTQYLSASVVVRDQQATSDRWGIFDKSGEDNSGAATRTQITCALDGATPNYTHWISYIQATGTPFEDAWEGNGSPTIPIITFAFGLDYSNVTSSAGLNIDINGLGKPSTTGPPVQRTPGICTNGVAIGKAWVATLDPAQRHYWKGTIGEFAMWNVQLTQRQLQILTGCKTKGMPLQIAPGNLLCYLPLDGVAKGVVAGNMADLSGHGRYGSVTGGSPVGAGETVFSYQPNE